MTLKLLRERMPSDDSTLLSHVGMLLAVDKCRIAQESLAVGDSAGPSVANASRIKGLTVPTMEQIQINLTDAERLIMLCLYSSARVAKIKTVVGRSSSAEPIGNILGVFVSDLLSSKVITGRS